MSTFEFLILNALSTEPMGDLAIARRVEQQTRGYFRSMFKMRSDSLETTLGALEREGWVSAEWQRTDHSAHEKTYSLAAAGGDRLEKEWAHRRSVLAQFVEEGGAGLFTFQTIHPGTSS